MGSSSQSKVAADGPQTTANEPTCEKWYVLFEITISNMPYLIFIIASFINYRQVKGSGFNKIVKYSKFFKFKLLICILATLINVISLILVMVMPETIDN